MARKTRKVSRMTAIETSENKMWKVALYARLSVLNSGRKDDGDSIENQISIVKDYIEAQSDMVLTSTFCDNGATGTNFEREAFERMMNDIKAGKINCICVKDCSRFGRSYIEAGEYLETIFPFMGVRFVAVNDGYDSLTANGTDDMILALKNLINTEYAKDISRKICSFYDTNRENGVYVASSVPLGYRKKDGKFVIDESTAWVVREIFRLKSEDKSDDEICRYFGEIGVLPPSALKGKGNKGASFWRPKAVRDICNNRAYIGDMVQGKCRTALWNGQSKEQKLPQSEWYICANAHEPIINRELWDKVHEIWQKRIEEKQAKSPDKPRKYSENIFKGMVFCDECGGRLTRYHGNYEGKKRLTTTYIFRCTHRFEGENTPCHKMYFGEKDLTEIVYLSIRERISLAADMEQTIEKLSKSETTKQNAKETADRILKIQREIARLSNLSANLYESYADKLLTESEYVYSKNKYAEQSAVLTAELERLQNEQLMRAELTPKNRFITAFTAFKKKRKLMRDMIVALIERVVVSRDKELEIVWKFADELTQLEQYIGDVK
jgi:DNA invertase Pin-like site-specific DNA recombinase